MWGEIRGGHHSRNWWVVHLDVNYVRAAMDFFDSPCIVKDQLYRMRSLKSGIAPLAGSGHSRPCNVLPEGNLCLPQGLSHMGYVTYDGILESHVSFDLLR